MRSDLAYDKATCQQLESQGLRAITQEAGHCLANKINASQYIEVSALKYLGIEQVSLNTIYIRVHFLLNLIASWLFFTQVTLKNAA